MSEAQFVPAIGEQFNSVWARGIEYNNFDMKFFTKKSHFQHKIALQCAFYGINGVGKSAKTTYRDMIGYPKDYTLITDSAGFQIASFKRDGKVCNIDPIDSLRWQEENADIAMNLDTPPTLYKTPPFHQFMDALNESYRCFEIFEKNRKNYDMKLYNVLHGEKLKMMNIWYNKVKHFNFEGWAIGMKPPFDPMIQALSFCFLWEKGVFDNGNMYGIHFFGTSGKHVVPTFAYMASKLKHQLVTYDSSSYNIGSIYRTYYSPLDIGPNLSFGEKFAREKERQESEEEKEFNMDFEGNINEIKNSKGFGENPEITKLPCMCPVCMGVKDILDLNKTDIFAGTLISLHNLFQYAHYNNIINSLVKNKKKFMEYLTTVKVPIKTLKSIEFIDFGIQHGTEEAIKKFSEYLQPQELNKSKQVGIHHDFSKGGKKDEMGSIQ